MRIVLPFIAATAAIGAMLLADPYEASAQPTETATVDGVDYPVCVEEDCSDQPGQVGVWTSREGKSYLELGEGITLPITPEA